jgi:DNA-binding transcriptional MerR regulator
VISARSAEEPERRWRLVELARMAGVSPQQVRNYIDIGLLPPVERTASGYRIFTARHAEALVTVRRVAAGHGWERARIIMNAVHEGDVAAALAAVDAGHADLARERADVAAAAEAFAAAAAAEPPPASRRNALIGQLARAIGVRPPVLRLWEQRGLLHPIRDRATGYRIFEPAEQRTAHLIAVLRRGNVPFAIVHPVVETMRATGSTTRALAELARRDTEIQQTSRRRLQGSAALLAYLDHGSANARGLTGPPQ